ncbi:MAG: hypothetical protein H0T94_10385 [Acidimicrobiia bacterium]|nr:hypothetical protein [Acidimicrobiia bacterium]
MSNQKRRNPYIILGIPYGAVASEARRGFAAKSRLIKREENSQYEIEDLTWALHELEQERAMDTIEIDVYRVPADPEALIVRETGLFNPLPEPLPITSGLSRLDVVDALEVAALLERYMTEVASTAVDLPDPLIERETK